jgi:hypothetical protein
VVLINFFPSIFDEVNKGRQSFKERKNINSNKISLPLWEAQGFSG